MTTMELKFYESGGLHEVHTVAAWDLGTIPAFACRRNRTKKPCVEMAGRMHSDIQPVAVRQIK
jgi:hypothetical protein